MINIIPLSRDAYLANGIYDITKSILSFKRTIIHKQEWDITLKYFHYIKVPIETFHMINYENYMKCFFNHGKNPFKYKVFIIKSKIALSQCSIDDYISRSKYYKGNY